MHPLHSHPHAKTLIVALRWQGQLRWYCSNYQDWILNKVKQAELLHIHDPDFSDRYGIGILSRDTADEFIRQHAAFELTHEELAAWVAAKPFPPTWEAVMEGIYPSMLIDFDLQMLDCYGGLPRAYGDFLPPGWNSGPTILSITKDIPEEQKYWLVDGFDRFSEWQINRLNDRNQPRPSWKLPEHLAQLDSYRTPAEWVKELTGHDWEELELIGSNLYPDDEDEFTYGLKKGHRIWLTSDWARAGYITKCLQELGAPVYWRPPVKPAWWMRLLRWVQGRPIPL